MKPYYEHGGITIYNADSREYSHIEKPAVICSDPPYGINHPCDFKSRMRGGLSDCRFDYPQVFGDDEPFDPSHLLALHVPTVLWGGNYFAHKLPPSSGWLVWDKERPHDLHQATCELAWTNFVKGARIFNHLWNGMMKASEQHQSYHPTQKPVALMQWCLTLKDCPPGLVFDGYMGAGPVPIAAKALGRRCVAFEVNEQYCEIAAKRLAQEVFDLK